MRRPLARCRNPPLPPLRVLVPCPLWVLVLVPPRPPLNPASARDVSRHQLPGTENPCSWRFAAVLLCFHMWPRRQATSLFPLTGTTIVKSLVFILCSLTFDSPARGRSSDARAHRATLPGYTWPLPAAPRAASIFWPKLVCSSSGGVACSSCASEYGRALRTDVAHPLRVGQRS